MNVRSDSDQRRRAENAAKVYLEMRGFSIIEQNWRRPRYKIDIIAEKDNIKHFIEVKYYNGNQNGEPVDPITATKMQMLNGAAKIYIEEHKCNSQYVLSTVEIVGSHYAVQSFIENV